MPEAQVVLLVLAAALLSLAAGCVSATPPYRAHADLPRAKPGITKVGLLDPDIRMFQEQSRFGLNETVPQADWSRVANEAVARALADEMSAAHVAVVPIATDDVEARELSELYGAVDLSIQRHAFEKGTGEMLPREPFDEKLHAFDYSLGPVSDLMARHQVDAVWIVRGFNLIPTAGVRFKHGVEVTLTILAALGGVGVPVIELEKLQLRAALIDRSGKVLYYGVAGTGRPPTAKDVPREAASGEPPPATASDSASAKVDLRDHGSARRILHAALARYLAANSP